MNLVKFISRKLILPREMVVEVCRHLSTIEQSAARRKAESAKLDESGKPAEDIDWGTHLKNGTLQVIYDKDYTISKTS